MDSSAPSNLPRGLSSNIRRSATTSVIGKQPRAALIEAKEAAESAESVDRAKSEFLAVVSHEVRHPN